MPAPEGDWESAPTDSKVTAYKAPPGFYMLFVFKHASESNSGLSKIPSNAKFVKLS